MLVRAILHIEYHVDETAYEGYGPFDKAVNNEEKARVAAELDISENRELITLIAAANRVVLSDAENLDVYPLGQQPDNGAISKVLDV